jgi:hypothetical protein
MSQIEKPTREQIMRGNLIKHLAEAIGFIIEHKYIEARILIQPTISIIKFLELTIEPELE